MEDYYDNLNGLNTLRSSLRAAEEVLFAAIRARGMVGEHNGQSIMLGSIRNLVVVAVADVDRELKELKEAQENG